jgi:hypothetical protein
MTQWQPIETAPKDGTPILVYMEESIIEAEWKYEQWWPVVLPSHGCGCCSHDNDEPTHWMPLPEPPKVTE